MIKRIYIIAILILGFLSSCVKDPITEEHIPDNGTKELKISLKPRYSEIKTRATSSEYEENTLVNAYIILFRFPDGYKDVEADEDEYAKYNVDNEHIITTWKLKRSDMITQGGEDTFTTSVAVDFSQIDTDATTYSLFAVVNYGEENAIMNLSDMDLDAIAAAANDPWGKLASLEVEMNPNNLSVERGTSFLMRGSIDNLTADSFSAAVGDTSKTIEIPLSRVDAKFSFYLKFTDNVNMANVDMNNSVDIDSLDFNADGIRPTAEKPRTVLAVRPQHWMVHNAPRKVGLVSATRHMPNGLPAGGDTVTDGDTGSEDTSQETYANLTFSSKPANFEGIGQTAAMEFSFYLLGQTYDAQKSIKDLFNVPEGGTLDIKKEGLSDFFGLDELVNGTQIQEPDGLVDYFNNPEVSTWQYMAWVLREKQNANITFDQARTNFVYAPQRSPYIEFELEIDYLKYNGEGKNPTRFVNDIRVVLHTGMGNSTTIFPKHGTKVIDDGVEYTIDGAVTTGYNKVGDEVTEVPDVDDYDIKDNTHYKHNLFWDGANSIYMEAIKAGGDENSEITPGMEGQLYTPRIFKRLNSGNSQFTYSMPDEYVSPLLGWAIVTPFSDSGGWAAYHLYDASNMKVQGDLNNIDHKWVYFAINPTTSDYADGKKMRIFPGEQEHKPDMYYEADYKFMETITIPAAWGGTIDVPVLRDPATGELKEGVPTPGIFYAPNENYWQFLEDFENNPKATKLLNIDQMMQISYLNAAGYYVNDKTKVIHDDSTLDEHTNPSRWYVTDKNQSPLSQIVKYDNLEGNEAIGRGLIVTVFVDEYYYYENPIANSSDSRKVQDGLWADFVNRAGKRVFSVVSPPRISGDLLSSYVGQSAVFEQEPIQTYYNLANAGKVVPTTGGYWSDNRQYEATKYIVYGQEAFMDRETYNILPISSRGNSGASVLFPSALNQSNNDYGVRNIRSGLRNTQLQWLRTMNSGQSIRYNGAPWNQYMDLETWELGRSDGLYAGEDYNAAIYQCLKRNRDEDGDGNLDVGEIKWYAPAITQLGYQWVGSGALNTEGQLYLNDDFSLGSTPLFSSTYVYSYDTNTTRGNSGGHMLSWVNEGYSISNSWDYVPSDYIPNPNGSGVILKPGFVPGGKYYGASETYRKGREVYVRCFRNIGTPKEEEAKWLNEMEPTEHEFVKAIVKTGPHAPSGADESLPAGTQVYKMSLENIDPLAYRRYTQSAELPMHHVFEDHNKPWSTFEVIADLSSTTYGGTLTMTQLNETFPQNTFYGHLDKVNNRIEENKPCPSGWRMPNQREAAIMQMMLQKRFTRTDGIESGNKSNTDEGWGDLTQRGANGSGYIGGPNPEYDKYIFTRTYGLRLKDGETYVPVTPSAIIVQPDGSVESLNDSGTSSTTGSFEAYGVTIELFDQKAINNVINPNDFTRIKWVEPNNINNNAYTGRVRCVRDI